MIKNCILISFFILATFNILGQNISFYIKPHSIDTNYSINQDSSKITVNTSTSNNKLFLFLGGTGSNTSNYFALLNKAANIGYAVINLSYPNDVAAASLSNNSDSLAFNKYRQELCFGTPLSNDVSVDSLNSIYSRFLNLLNYLDTTNNDHNWSQYLNSTASIDWNKIAIGGHSQGAGHAVFLAKTFIVDRALMFSGPNDYSDYFSNSANWLRNPGVTPISDFYSYLSLNDEVVDFTKQYTNINGLGMLQSDDTTLVDYLVPPYGNSKCLYTTQPPGFVILNHNVTTKNTTINDDVWEYMLTNNPTSGVIEKDTFSFNSYPNPIKETLTVTSKSLINEIKIINSLGEVIITKKNIKSNTTSLHLSEINLGIYYLVVNNKGKVVVKL